MGLCAGDGGTAWRRGAEELGLTSGDDQLREPRLPVDFPPPARAQASSVHKHTASNIMLTLVTATVRFITCLLLKWRVFLPPHPPTRWDVVLPCQTPPSHARPYMPCPCSVQGQHLSGFSL